MNPVKRLLTYRYAEIIHDLTHQFCLRYLRSLSHLSKRNVDQMIQAARSGKQNIVEGVGQSQTSKKGEIKLLGVAKASFEELGADFEDYLRQHQLLIYPKDHPKVTAWRQEAYRLSSLSNLSSLGHLREKPTLPDNPTDAANFLLTLCHIETYLLHRQIKAAEASFVRKGGYTENLFQKRIRRLKYLRSLK
ncbi:MAG: four helix bundle protein [Candidatus Chisholmbacteria bacterium]|nr:four helix bundle protein [Candidatus Chisholmbacteria bacterium]